MGVKQQMEGGGGGGGGSSKGSNGINLLERKARPEKEQALKCPRCNSTNTKFCYYNNYSLSQPRYFCKACRRYWTEGGSLRNVPVGGGSRKNKRSSSLSSPPQPSDHKKINAASHQNPNILHHAHHQDLNLAIFPPNATHPIPSFMPPPPPPNAAGIFNAAAAGFALHDLKPTLGFSLEGFQTGAGYGDNNHHHHHHHQNNQDQDQTAVMFPIEDLKQSNGAADQFEQNRGGDSGGGGGYWNGMLGGSW